MNKLYFDPPIIAHRGASAYAPENTLAAFIKAAQMGINWLEFDVMQTACGESIVFHDETLERTTNGAGLVIDYPYSLLHSLDAGKWFAPEFSGERIPALEEVLSLLDEMHLNANIEIKALPTYEKTQVKAIVKRVMPYLKNSNSTFLFSSFSWVTLSVLRELMPDCLLGLLIHHWTDGWENEARKLRCDSIHVNERILTKRAAESIKHTNKLLLCYTVNTIERAKVLFSWGVDAIFTDVPDLIKCNHHK